MKFKCVGIRNRNDRKLRKFLDSVGELGVRNRKLCLGFVLERLKEFGQRRSNLAG